MKIVEFLDYHFPFLLATLRSLSSPPLKTFHQYLKKHKKNLLDDKRTKHIVYCPASVKVGKII